MKDVSQNIIDREEANERRPAEIYKVWMDTGQEWFYTSSDESVVYNGDTYEPALIKRGQIEYNSDLDTTQINIQLAHVNTIVTDFISSNPVDIIWVSIMKTFKDLADEATVIFVGQIKDVAFKGNIATARCVGLDFFLQQTIPRYRYQNTCNNTLYDTKCSAPKASYKTTTNVSVSSDGLTLTSTDFGTQADTYFTRGYIEWNNYKRMIISHSGNDIGLRYSIPGLTTGQAIDAYAGCDLKIETCESKFNNKINFIGFPAIPVDNPTLRRF